MNLNPLERLETAVGYAFKDKSLLRRAMTHSSHSNETGERNHHLLCNERLEFLGDSVLSIVVSRYLYTAYPQEGEGILTNMRKDVVCAEALARYARRIGIGDCLLLGKGEAQSGGYDKENILADAFEALLAAIYLDAGERGMDIIAAFLLPLVQKDLSELESKGIDGDYKTPLQQLVQQTEGDVLEYVLIRADGPDHQKTFEVEVRVNSNPCGRGIGTSKRKAEQAAAKAALKVFGIC
ncbi:MAG: ribonuclease III [Clostridia bacterium]|nr:ribonuclease III [Clostridia bacterium]